MGTAPRLLQALLETVDAGIVICDCQGRITHHNRRAGEMLGWSAAGAPSSCAELDPLIAAPLAGALAGHAVHEVELRTASGTVIGNARPYLDGDSGEPGAVLALHDAAGQSRIAQVLEMIGDAFILIDPEWRYGYVNAKAAELAGRSREVLLGKSVWDEFPEAVYGAFYRELHRAVEENRPVHFENYFAPLGKWFQNDAYPSPDGVSVFYRDITERKRIENDLLTKAEELARSNADLQQFTYAVSHDLQEPLRTVNTYTQMLAKRLAGQLNEDSTELMTGITDSARRMRDMIRDLLVYSQVAQGGAEDWFGPVNLEEVLAWAAENLRIAIAESGAVITNDPLPVVPAVEVQMRQLFQNLLGNAIKYSGDKPPRIHIGAKVDGRNLALSFRDNGMGIDPSQKEQIFKLFKQGRPNGKPEGTGVGLALCRRIAMRHGGRLEVESVPNNGATFHLWLPARASDV